MNIFVLFGITGDLARKKVIPSLAALSKDYAQTTGSGEPLCIGVGRKAAPPLEFMSLKRGLYVSGDLAASSLYKKILVCIKREVALLKKTKKLASGLNLMVYSASPPHMHAPIAEMMRKEVTSVLIPLLVGSKKVKTKLRSLRSKKLTTEPVAHAIFSLNIRFVIEKPIGNSLADAEAIFAQFEKFPEDHEFFFVDHYLAKEPLIEMQKLAASNPELFSATIGSHALKEIKVLLFEKNDVTGRGAFYDSVGALYDVGQNHLLQVLATMLTMRQRVLGAQEFSKASIMSKLRLSGTPQFGQYLGYTDTDHVGLDSTTETFFNISFNVVGKETKGALNPLSNLGGVLCTITSGKALPESRSGIELTYTNGKVDFIDLSTGSKDAYQLLFEAVLEGRQDIFAKKEEIIAAWKIVERAKKLKTKRGLVIYRASQEM